MECLIRRCWGQAMQGNLPQNQEELATALRGFIFLAICLIMEGQAKNSMHEHK
jgi:hypothetical protein